MLSDTFAIGLALVALILAARPSTPRRSFGFQRAEILAAFVNGLTLVLVSGWIVWEAISGSATRRTSSAAGCWSSRSPASS